MPASFGRYTGLLGCLEKIWRFVEAFAILRNSDSDDMGPHVRAGVVQPKDCEGCPDPAAGHVLVYQEERVGFVIRWFFSSFLAN